MVRGCIDWHHDGLKIPCSVRAATDEYRTEQDVSGRYMRDIFVPAEHCQIKFSDLYTAMERWCYESGDFKPSKKFVGAWLKDNGYKEKQSGGRWYLGIGFKPHLE
jgi:putative DNA primase/helicase